MALTNCGTHIPPPPSPVLSRANDDCRCQPQRDFCAARDTDVAVDGDANAGADRDADFDADRGADVCTEYTSKSSTW